MMKKTMKYMGIALTVIGVILILANEKAGTLFLILGVLMLITARKMGKDSGETKAHPSPSLISSDQISKTSFDVDFADFGNDEKLQKCHIDIDLDKDSYITVNGEETYIGSKYVDELGWSSDHKYKKIRSNGCTFWITPADYDSFANCLKMLQRNYGQSMRERYRELSEQLDDYNAGYESDEVGTDPVTCFIPDDNKQLDRYVDDAARVKETISAGCEESGGRFFKTAAKGAEYAVILNPASCSAKSVEALREKGYKVVTASAILTHFGRGDLYTDSDAASALKKYTDDISVDMQRIKSNIPGQMSAGTVVSENNTSRRTQEIAEWEAEKARVEASGGIFLDPKPGSIASAVSEFTITNPNPKPNKIERTTPMNRKKAAHATGQACCPRCGSTSLTTNQKGYGIGKGVVGAWLVGPIGLVAGNAGRHKITVTCLNCGYKFKPGQKF